MKPFQNTGIKLGEHRVRYRLRQKQHWTISRGYYSAWQLLMWIGYDGRWDVTPAHFVTEEDRRKAKRRMHRSLRNLRKDEAYYL